MTESFIPLLLKSTNPRLLFITSGASQLTTELELAGGSDSPEKGWPKPSLGTPAYRAAKTGLNMMMLQWHQLLAGDGIKVWAISPGMLTTDLGGVPEIIKAKGGKDPALGGEFIRDVVEGSRDEDVGKVIRRGGVQPW
jgi:NAD(P)-dependent dehydrogenase (short-subunit alcohol dehydrogenase family)